MKHIIFYIPGLGDGYDRFRQKALRLWVIFGVHPILIPMRWDDDEPYKDKFQRVTDAIEQATTSRTRITLIGESAGASMAINAFAAHTVVASLVTIAGVNTSGTPVAAYRLRRSPAFAESRQRLDDSLKRLSVGRKNAIHTVSAASDNAVPARHSLIAGARNYRLWTIGHLATITLCLTLLSGYIVSLAKRK